MAPTTAADGSAIRCAGISKTFGPHTAVADLDLEIPRGAIYGLLGPNGSGKTTTIRMIMGILLPDSGDVALLGREPDGAAREGVGYLPEERGLYRKMKVLDLLVFLGEIRGLARSEARERAGAWLERLDLGEWKEHRAEDLSKGMQQKVQFIATILHRPALLILDEPFGGLDPINQGVLEEIVREFHRRGGTVVLSTHMMEQAERLCEHVCLISRARKVLDGRLSELRRAEGKGVVEVDFDGDAGWIAGPEVRRAEGDGGEWSVSLREGADGRDLLERALGAGVRIHRFERVWPSLREIFIRHAGDRGAEEAAREAPGAAPGGGLR